MGILADGLSRRGHQVTLYAPQGSRTKAKLIDLGSGPFDYVDRSEADINRVVASKLRYLTALFRRADEYDVIHLHTEPYYLGAPFLTGVDTPVIITNHNRFIDEDRRLLKLFPKLNVVTISKRQAALRPPGTRSVRTVYNGLDVSKYRFGPSNSGRFLFLGRVSEEKGITQAIEAARQAGIGLDIAGPCTPSLFESQIKPLLSKNIRYLGVIKGTKLRHLLRNARAALLPTNWEEPFGMVFIEAMASGTPVISFAQGAAPEVIKDGETGYLVNRSRHDKRGAWEVKQTSTAGIVSAILKVCSLPPEEYLIMRHASRRRVEKHFTVERMLDGYEAAYEKITKR
ncbi:MAG: glycosyltransferase family 4 protein [Patescibacteria group bacterium]